jgi:hypothetical protein
MTDKFKVQSNNDEKINRFTKTIILDAANSNNVPDKVEFDREEAILEITFPHDYDKKTNFGLSEAKYIKYIWR